MSNIGTLDQSLVEVLARKGTRKFDQIWHCYHKNTTVITIAAKYSCMKFPFIPIIHSLAGDDGDSSNMDSNSNINDTSDQTPVTVTPGKGTRNLIKPHTII